MSANAPVVPEGGVKEVRWEDLVAEAISLLPELREGKGDHTPEQATKALQELARLFACYIVSGIDHETALQEVAVLMGTSPDQISGFSEVVMDQL